MKLSPRELELRQRREADFERRQINSKLGTSEPSVNPPKSSLLTPSTRARLTAPALTWAYQRDYMQRQRQAAAGSSIHANEKAPARTGASLFQMLRIATFTDSVGFAVGRSSGRARLPGWRGRGGLL